MRRALIAPFAILLCSICLPSSATVVHKWVDADGVTHFSDEPPTGIALEVDTVEFNGNLPPPVDTRDDYYSIANQWKRMREEREAKTRLRLEWARIRADASPEVLRAEPPPAHAATYYPVVVDPYARHYGDWSTGRHRHHVQRATTAREPRRLKRFDPHFSAPGSGSGRETSRRRVRTGTGIRGARHARGRLSFRLDPHH